MRPWPRPRFPRPGLLPSGDSAITVEFSRNIDDAANQRVLALDRTLAEAPIAGVTETVPTYRSLLVHYDPGQIDFATLGEKLLALAQRAVSAARRRGAGASRSPMAGTTASIWKRSPKRSTRRLMTSSRGMSRAATASP